jgi:predicted nucleotidyltransferase
MSRLKVRSKKDIQSLGLRFGRVVDEFFDDIEIRLFGSYFKGNPNIQSDVDFAVISRDFRGMDNDIALKLLGRMTVKVDTVIEAVAITPEEFKAGLPGSIAWEIKRHSRSLYRSKSV